MKHDNPMTTVIKAAVSLAFWNLIHPASTRLSKNVGMPVMHHITDQVGMQSMIYNPTLGTNCAQELSLTTKSLLLKKNLLSF